MQKIFLAGWPEANRQLDALKNHAENFNLVCKMSISSCKRKMAKARQFFKDP